VIGIVDIGLRQRTEEPKPAPDRRCAVMKRIPCETDARLEVLQCRVADVKLTDQVRGRTSHSPQVTDFTMDLRGVGLHLITYPQIQSQTGTRMPIVLNIPAKNFIAHIVLVTRHKIGGQNRGARLIRSKIGECAARSVDARRARFRAVVSRYLRDEPRGKGAVAIDSVDCNDVILLSQKSETELQTVIAA